MKIIKTPTKIINAGQIITAEIVNGTVRVFTKGDRGSIPLYSSEDQAALGRFLTELSNWMMKPENHCFSVFIQE